MSAAGSNSKKTDHEKFIGITSFIRNPQRNALFSSADASTALHLLSSLCHRARMGCTRMKNPLNYISKCFNLILLQFFFFFFQTEWITTMCSREDTSMFPIINNIVVAGLYFFHSWSTCSTREEKKEDEKNAEPHCLLFYYEYFSMCSFVDRCSIGRSKLRLYLVGM